MIKRTSSEKALLSLSLLGAISILPFMFIRWFEGNITLAIIDGVVSLSALIFFLFVLITRETSAAKNSFAIFLTIGVLVTIFVKGEEQLFWVSPVIISIYFLMPLKLAKFTSVVLVFFVLIIIYNRVGLGELLTILSTTLLTVSLSYVVSRSYNDKKNELNLLASIDSLTSSGNRRALDKKLTEVTTNHHREADTISLILIDLDNFKEINDNYGHAAGDHILIKVCELIVQHTRLVDALYRYGGDEFIITPINMPTKAARALAEKIRHVIEKHEFIQNIKITLSIGVAEYKEHDSLESWISRADKALYKAKGNGRNSVC